ncbi:MAG: hypothetical protein H0W76_29010 [Pyrinomonadaceae bacterium]|nr:hypothetical protein [Pyrinomonadaceae bacterium]
MKRCSACDRSYNDDQKFCEEDGTTLVAVRPTSSNNQIWVSALVGVAIGLMFAAIAFAAYYTTKRGAEDAVPRGETAKLSSSAAAPLTKASPMPVIKTETAITPTPTLIETPSPEPAPVPASTSSPTLAVENTRERVNTTPISTSPNKESASRGPSVIRLYDGTIIEADDAWEDKQGVWYRRGGLVVLVERSRVETIKRRSASQTPMNSSPDSSLSSKTEPTPVRQP